MEKKGSARIPLVIKFTLMIFFYVFKANEKAYKVFHARKMCTGEKKIKFKQKVDMKNHFGHHDILNLVVVNFLVNLPFNCR